VWMLPRILQWGFNKTRRHCVRSCTLRAPYGLLAYLSLSCGGNSFSMLRIV
jgi:hypothetical protein